MNKNTQKFLIFSGILAAIAMAIGLLINPNMLLIFLGVFLCLIFLAIYIEIGLYLVIILLPFTGWLMDFGTIGAMNLNFINNIEMPPVDFLAVILLLAFLARQFYLRVMMNKKEELKYPFIKSFCLFFTIVLISSLLSNNWAESSWYAFRWIAFFYAVYIWLPVNIIRDKKVLRNVIIAFVVSGLSVALIGFYSLFTQDWYNEFVRVKPIGFGRIYPLTSNHNVLAEMLAISIFFAVSLGEWFKSMKKNKSHLFIALFIATIMLGTFSRAAWIALAVELLVYLYFYYKLQSKKLFSEKNIAVVLVVALLIFVPAIYMFQLQSSSIGKSSTNTRVILTQIAGKAFIAKPWLGHGTGEYIKLVDNNIRYRAQHISPLESHGVWQKILAENGMFGVMAFLIFSIAIFSFFYKSLKRYKDSWQIILPLIVASSGIYIFEFFNTSYYKGKLWLPIAVATAAIYIIAKKQKELSHEK